MKTVGIITVLTSVANLALAYIGWQVSMPPATFGPYQTGPVVGLTVLGVVGAGVVYLLMRRWYKDTNLAVVNRRFIILSLVVLIVSFYPDIAMPWSTDADQVGWTYGIIANLMLMHVVAGVPVMYYFTKA